MNVLIVSEEASRRQWVSRALGPRWEVLEATNGRDAVRIAEDEYIDLVVTDQTAEPFGAFGLARELKALDEPPAVVILLERRQDTWLATWSGADAWLLWPVDPFELADTAARLSGAGGGAAASESARVV